MHEFLEIWYFTIKLHCNCSSWREGKKRQAIVWLEGHKNRDEGFLADTVSFQLIHGETVVFENSCDPTDLE